MLSISWKDWSQLITTASITFQRQTHMFRFQVSSAPVFPEESVGSRAVPVFPNVIDP
jgi:hypothetical protein